MITHWKSITLFVVSGALSLALISCTQTQSTPGGDILGDYLFNEKQMRAVFLVHVFEEGGEVYALLDIADQKAKLEPLDSGKAEYLLRLPWGNEFTLSFLAGGGGEVTRLKLKSETRDLQLTGEKIQLDLARLRDYHSQPTDSYTYRVPLQVENGWEVATLDETGVNASLLSEMMDDILKNHGYVHSVLIVKNGRLVFEEYLNGWDPLRLHRLQSVSKSFTSTLVGMAIEQGLIESLGDPLYEYLPEYFDLFDDSKKGILIEHLLTMTAGFEWNELETYYENPDACDSHAAEASGDYIRYVLEKQIANEPGSTWYYNSGFPNILGYIIEQRSETTLLDFSWADLFEPLGIRRAYWQPITGEDRPSCAGGLRLTSRDMARYGQLYLNGGSWNGDQILPSYWIEQSTRRQIDTGLDSGYGYFWRHHSADGLDVFLASGTGGQFIVCVPAFNAVVVTTARYNTDKSDAVAGLLLKYVVPALATSVDSGG